MPDQLAEIKASAKDERDEAEQLVRFINMSLPDTSLMEEIKP